MVFFNKLFKGKSVQPAEPREVTLTNDGVKVDYPDGKMVHVRWTDIETVSIITTDQGPYKPDVWLALTTGNEKCMIPQGTEAYDQAYDIVSKYKGFDFEQVIAAASCTNNREFSLWQKEL